MSVGTKAKKWIRQIIGRTPQFEFEIMRTGSRPYTLDWTRMDYNFYDLLRHGKAVGYSLGSLFAKRIESIFASWIFGSGVVVKTERAHDYTDKKLAEFITRILDDGLMQVYEDSMGLGDQWIIVNADGTLSIPSPDTVDVTTDPTDYRKVIQVKVTTKDKTVVVEDSYFVDMRIVTVTNRLTNQTATEIFVNFFDEIPVVHVPYARGRNEIYGRSVHEQLLNLYSQYDDIIYKQIDGAKLLGNPIPTFTGLEDPNAVQVANAPTQEDTFVDKDGTTVTRKQFELDQNSVMFVGAGGDFKFVGPFVGFSADTRNALKSLFLLLLDHTGIPEFLWGNELSSGKASSETQLTQWIHDITGKQHTCSAWIRDLARLYLKAVKLTDRRVVVDELVVHWPPLTIPDQNMLLKRIEFARHTNLITDETALKLLRLVEDPAREAAAARQEAEERAEAAADRMDVRDNDEDSRQLSDEASPDQARNEATGD